MIEIRKVNKIYKTKKNHIIPALTDINLEFKEKGLIFILGPSGCGKSTLLNLIGGIDIPTDGDILFKGKEIGKKEELLDKYRNKYVGFVFQSFNLIENLTVYDNLSLVCQKEEEIKESLKQVRLEGYEERYPSELSGGEAQRVAIARTLLKQSQFILADEPTGNLNKKQGIEVFEILKEIAKEKIIIVVSHNEEMAKEYADRIIRMEDGKIVSDEKIKNTEVAKFTEEKQERKLDKKSTIKLIKQTVSNNKLDFIVSFLTILLSFLCLTATLSIISYNRTDVDIKNLKTNNEIQIIELNDISSKDIRNLTLPQYYTLKEEYNDVLFLEIPSNVKKEISSADELVNFGFEFHNYIELTNEGIYVFEFKLQSLLSPYNVFYDKECTLPFNEEVNFDYSNLIGKYIKLKDGVLRLEGVLKDLANFSDSKSDDDVIKNSFLSGINKTIFYSKNFIYKNVIPANTSIITLYPNCVMINDKNIENCLEEFQTLNIEKVRTWYFNGVVMSTDGTIYKSTENNLPELKNNEVYITLELYNKLFDEQVNENDYVKETGNDYFNYEYSFIKKLEHLGETISISFFDERFDNYKLEYDNLVIKGVVLYSHNFFDYHNDIVLSDEVASEIYKYNQRPDLYAKKDSLGNINDFVKYCSIMEIVPSYYGVYQINEFEKNIYMIKVICSILSVIFTILSFLIMYGFVNRTIKRRKNEIGILKSIGICNKDIIKINLLWIIVINILLIIIIIPTSIMVVNLINNILITNLYSKLILVYYKWWFIFITLGLLFAIEFVTFRVVSNKLKSQKIIYLIKH